MIGRAAGAIIIIAAITGKAITGITATMITADAESPMRRLPIG